jgi:hypothetical protein
VKDDAVYLRHILDAIDRIVSYTAAGRKSFRSDLKTQDAYYIRDDEYVVTANTSSEVDLGMRQDPGPALSQGCGGRTPS